MLLTTGAWTGYQAVQARDALLSAAANVDAAVEAVREGEARSARRLVVTAERDAVRALDLTSGTTWRLATRLPALGDDVAAVRTVSSVVHEVTGSLDDAVAAGEALSADRLRPRAGRIPLRPLQRAEPLLASVADVLTEQRRVVAALDSDGLVAPLADPVVELQEQLAEASRLSSGAATALRVLPPMLGAEDARTYLVLSQNNAEIRATGGMPGAFSLMRADAGRLTLGDQGTAGDLGSYERPPVPLTAEELAVYGPKLGTFPSNITFTPEFPRTAELGRAMLAAAAGVRVDGVLSLDPVALSYLLEVTGPVDLPDGLTLSGGNAVRVLLNDVYRTEPDPERQNAFFAEAARAVFAAVTSGRGDPVELARAFGRASEEGRVYAWSSRPEEQRHLADTALGGAVPATAERAPYVGFFLNDGTATKLQYYLEHRVDVRPTACNIEGRQTLEVTARLRSHAPADAHRLPASIIGPREDGTEFLRVKPGHMRVNAHLYAPVGGWIDEVTLDEQAAPFQEKQHLGHPVSTHSILLAPGQERVLRYTVRTGLDQPGDAELRVTPGARSAGVGTVAASACSDS